MVTRKDLLETFKKVCVTIGGKPREDRCIVDDRLVITLKGEQNMVVTDFGATSRDIKKIRDIIEKELEEEAKHKRTKDFIYDVITIGSRENMMLILDRELSKLYWNKVIEETDKFIAEFEEKIKEWEEGLR
ncbi:MAG TPA: hypothetical protein ENG74_00800 [Thermoplasmatales archaeon]|nr:hypothetical protein [Thermoplasmatales archaeon]